MGDDQFDHSADAGAVRQRSDPDRRGRRVPRQGHQDVADIGQAFQLLSPLLGLSIASLLFAIALLASGVNSTVTATFAGQIVMEGFLRLRVPHWARRLITRAIAIIPSLLPSPSMEPGRREPAGLQSSDTLHAIAFRRHTARAVRLRQEEDGRVRHLAQRGDTILDSSCNNSGSKCQAAL